MLFSSNAFIFRFLLLFMIIYFIAQSKYRNGILLAGSLIFYGIGEPKFVWIMLASVMLNYVLSKRIYQYKGKGLLIVTILLNVAVLGWFKYLDFGIENINAILGKSWLTPLEIALPIGISFYTFLTKCLISHGYRLFKCCFKCSEQCFQITLNFQTKKSMNWRMHLWMHFLL